MRTKRRLMWLLMTCMAASLLMGSYWAGRQRYRSRECLLAHPLPVPVIHTHYSGVVQHQNGHHLRVAFKPEPAPQNPSRPYFWCTGYFQTRHERFYLLELDDVIYVERAVFVDPFLRLMRYAETHGQWPDALPLEFRDLENVTGLLDAVFSGKAPETSSHGGKSR